MIDSVRIVTAGVLAAALIAATGCGDDIQPIDSAQPTTTAAPAATSTTVAATSSPEPTGLPTEPAATPTATSGEPDDLSLDSVRETSEPQTIVSGGVSITISRLAVADYAEFYDKQDAAGRRSLDTFSDTGGAITIGQIEIAVENGTDQPINIYPDQGVAIVGNEQVDVSLFLSDDVGGEYFPGVLKEGRVYFFLEPVPTGEIESVTYVVDGAFGEDLGSLGDNFQFTVAVAAR